MNKSKFQDLIRNSGKTKDELAAELGISTRQLRRYETGESEPVGSKIAEICRYFQVSADWLLDL